MPQCLGGRHAAGCRRGRPLCRERRRESEKHRPCFCGAADFPHRRGWCTGGRATEYMWESLHVLRRGGQIL